MVTTYASTCDVADFLRISITACTTPSIAQITKLINRNEERIDRRTGHTYGRAKTETEIYPVHLLYTFGHGSMLTLKHREIRTTCDGIHLCACSCDSISIWNGACGGYQDLTTCTAFYDVEPIKGDVYLRGLIFTILRQDRIKITYRYGSTTVPDDIKDACIKLTAIDILRSSIKMDDLAFGGAIDKERAMDNWKEEVDQIIRDREEVYILP